MDHLFCKAVSHERFLCQRIEMEEFLQAHPRLGAFHHNGTIHLFLIGNNLFDYKEEKLKEYKQSIRSK